MEFTAPVFCSRFPGNVVLRDGTEFPLREIFERNPSIHDVRGFRCDAHPHLVSYAKAWSMWDEGAQRHQLVRLGLGAYGDHVLAVRHS